MIYYLFLRILFFIIVRRKNAFYSLEKIYCIHILEALSQNLFINKLFEVLKHHFCKECFDLYRNFQMFLFLNCNLRDNHDELQQS